jgi:uncharacterized membrane protein
VVEAAPLMIQFTYTPEVRWVLSGAVVAAAALFLSYVWARRKSNRWLRIGLVGLRVLTISAVVLCLLDPEWVEAIKHQPKSRLAVLLDSSRSMSAKDVSQGRLAAAKSWLQKKFNPSVPATVAVDYYTFSQTLAPLASLDSVSATGDATAVADALESLLAIPRDDPLVGVLICSDGIENMRKDPEAVAKSYRRKGIPIHTATVGTTNEMQDIIVENVHVKRAVPNQAPTRIGISLRVAGYRNQTVPVQVLGGNQTVAVQEVKLKDGTQRIEMDFTPRQRGFQIYEVRVPVQNGEWLATNNRRLFGLEVIDPNIQVIYMEGTPQQPSSPIPEWKYLADALKSDPHIKVKTLYRQFGASGQFLNTVDADPQTGERIYPVEHPTLGFPHVLAELLNYDVIIHSDIRTQSFTGEQLQNMARLVEEYGGGFAMIGGNSAFGKGGYHRTILDRIIPVAMERENDSQARPFRLSVPSAALAHPIIALGATREETQLIWTSKFPVLYGCNLVDRAKPGAIVLGEDPDSRNAYGPRLILAAQNVGKGRSLAFTSDTTRSWGKDFETTWGEPINSSLPLSESNCDNRYYRQFWVNAVRWLAAGRIGRTNNPVTLELAQGYSLPNEKVAATVKVRDPNLNALGAAEVTLVLSSGGKTQLPVKGAFDRVSQAYRFDLLPPNAGDFVVTAVATLKGQKLGEDRQLLVCESGDREMADLRANPELMAKLARASGGQAFAVTDQGAGPDSAVFGAAAPVTVEYRHTPLWDKSWWLGTILFLLTAEWAVRRLSGLA